MIHPGLMAGAFFVRTELFLYKVKKTLAFI